MASAPGNQKAEPNLTPLLDLVLQLVMFFMLVTHFEMEQVNESIKLPLAIEAKSLDKDVQGYIVLNVNDRGQVLLGQSDNAETLDNEIQVFNYMRIKFERDKAVTKPADWEKGLGRSLIILRASKDCTYKQVHDVMSACQRAGYTNIQLRAIKVSAD